MVCYLNLLLVLLMCMQHGRGLLSSTTVDFSYGSFLKTQKYFKKFRTCCMAYLPKEAAGRVETVCGRITGSVLARSHSRSRTNQRSTPLYTISSEIIKPDLICAVEDEAFNRKCLPCPKDNVVVAKRKSLKAPFSLPAFQFPCRRQTRGRVVVHINAGPRPRQMLTAGRYPVFLTLIQASDDKPYRATQCSYTHEVIVNKCEAFVLDGKNVNVRCTHENAWGSNCTFSCASGFQRRGPAKTRCKNNLSWSHQVPKCIRRKSRGDCKLTGFEGKFECRSKMDAMVKMEYVAPGTVCQLTCMTGYAVPASQRHLTVISCDDGRWNSTEDPLCLPKPTLRPVTRVLRVNKPRYQYFRKKDKGTGSKS